MLAGDCARDELDAAAAACGGPFDHAEFASGDEFDALDCVAGLTELLI